jgi:signal transduction histidine kinase
MDTPRDAQPTLHALDAGVALPPARILLVDDTPANLVALRALLEPLGQELVAVGSGREALAQLEADPGITLALIDIRMPILDGFEVVERIRQAPSLRHLPVMFLTAFASEEQLIERGYQLGAVDYITKPFNPTIVRAKVKVFVTLHERSEQLKHQERRLVEAIAARATAEQARALSEQFVGILGHDLRNPLNTILLSAQQLETLGDGRDIAQARQLGLRIVRSGRRMARMIRDVLEFTRVRLGGGVQVSPELVDLAQVCQVPVEEIRTIHPDCAIGYDVRGNVRGIWDPDRIGQVVANLLDNAVKHSGAATTGTRRVRLGLSGQDDVVVITVHNDGEPIPEEVRSRLFEPFQRADARGQTGLGLGLYIVERIVRAHGGTVEVQSTPAEGTTFAVRLPRHGALLPAMAAK